jgi:uncharacterized protein involved in cysteine biosynthesis
MFCETLLNLSSQSVAVAAFVGAAISVLVELAGEWWENLPHDAKRWIVLLLCLGVPFAALLLGVYAFSCAMVITAETIATAIAAGCQAFVASQITHLYVRNHR